MAANDSPEVTKVTDRGMVTIPADIRRRLDIDGGDTLKWTVTEEGKMTVRVVRQRYGAFADDELMADLGESDPHDLAGYEFGVAEDV